MKSTGAIDVISEWYESKCDGRWEHEFGAEIGNIDNPGWNIKLTGEANRRSVETKIDRSDGDWVHVNAIDNAFTAWGGLVNFSELLE